jgi:hypothetical protein
MSIRWVHLQATDGSCSAAARSIAAAAAGGRSAARIAARLLLALAMVGLTLSLGSCAGSSSAESSAAVRVDWRMLAGLDVPTGNVPADLAAVLGRSVRLPGYVVPLEDDARDVSEFLLVPSFGACIHTPPPLPNQMVYVVMEPGRDVDVDWWGFDPIWIEGILEITDEDSPYGAVAFSMRGTDALTWGEGWDGKDVWR